MIQIFRAFPVYNGTLAAVDYGRPASNSIVSGQFPASAAAEITYETEWLVTGN